MGRKFKKADVRCPYCNKAYNMEELKLEGYVDVLKNDITSIWCPHCDSQFTI